MVNHRPPKVDPNRIQIVAGGNLIDSTGELSVPTANIDTEKLHWNSVISPTLAKYMCMDIKSFYLLAVLEYYEYMKILFALFPQCTIKQYGLDCWVSTRVRDTNARAREKLLGDVGTIL